MQKVKGHMEMKAISVNLAELPKRPENPSCLGWFAVTETESHTLNREIKIKIEHLRHALCTLHSVS